MCNPNPLREPKDQEKKVLQAKIRIKLNKSNKRKMEPNMRDQVKKRKVREKEALKRTWCHTLNRW